MAVQGYVVVLRNDEPGVTRFPGVPNSEGLADLMRAQTRASGREVVDPPKYLSGTSGVIGFTIDKKRAQVFATRQQAQGAIDQIPAMVRPAGLSVEPLSD
jgi:hypothetical protein